MIDLSLAVFTAYIVACVIGSSSLFEAFREYVKRKAPGLKIGQRKHFIECRLCLTFWTSCFAVLLFALSPSMIFPIYGAAYFLATQER